jgi:hypothetical protein
VNYSLNSLGLSEKLKAFYTKISNVQFCMEKVLQTLLVCLCLAEGMNGTRQEPHGFFAVLGIRIRMYLDLPDPDPDPIDRGMDPDPAPDPSLFP